MLELTALGTWIGGLIILVGAVIPAVFNTFGGQDSGGFFLTRAFEGYNRIVLIAVAVLTLGTVGRAWLNRRGVIDYPVSSSEWNVLGLMVLIAGAITFVLHPQAAALQAQAFATKGDAARRSRSTHSFDCTGRFVYSTWSIWDSASCSSASASDHGLKGIRDDGEEGHFSAR